MRDEIIRLRAENDALREKLAAAQGDITSLKGLLRSAQSLRADYFRALQQVRTDLELLRFEQSTGRILGKGGGHAVASG